MTLPEEFDISKASLIDELDSLLTPSESSVEVVVADV